MQVIDLAMPNTLRHDISHIIPSHTFELMSLVTNNKGKWGMCDRTRMFDIPWVKNLYPLFERYPSKSFTDICLARARDLISKDLRIDLYWSGGIDSTVALCSLLMVGVPRDQLNVMHTIYSIFEYPVFYEKVVKKLNNELIPPSIDGPILRGNLIVNGEPGDLLYGSEPKNYVEKWESYTRFYESVLHDIDVPWKDSPIYRNASDITKYKLECMVSIAPYEVSTFRHFWGWLVYCIGFQETPIFFGSNLNKEDYTEYLRLNDSFFNTKEFENWSLQCSAVNSDREFRKPSRDLIYSYFPDRYYYDYKRKFISHIAVSTTDMLARFEDGTRINNRVDLLQLLGENGYV